MKTKIGALLSSAFAASLISISASAATISPESFETTLSVGDTVVVNKTVTLDELSPVTSKLDLVFLADTTGSMSSEITSVRSQANSLMTSIAGLVGDVNFGVSNYDCDPSESCATTTTAFTVGQAITADTMAAQTAINGWVASGGGDIPEANLYALDELATDGAVSGHDIAWRDDASKVVVWFGDARSHETTVSKEQTLADLLAKGITVIAIDVGDMDSTGQASFIADGTGGIYASASSSTIVDTILAAVEETTSTIDLVLAAVGDTSGLDVEYACVDALGCDNVGSGESRDFTMTVTALADGDYVYDTIAIGTDAVEHDMIHVSSVSPAPSVAEPGSIALLGLGLAGLGMCRRKKA